MESETDLEFRRAMGAFATGVTVVSAARADGRLTGMTVNSMTAVSLQPRLILWCLGDKSDRYEHFAEADAWGLTVLGAGDEQIARRFAKHGADPLAPADVEDYAGAPVLNGVGLAHLSCVTHDRRIAGDHLIIIGEVRAFRMLDGAGLMFFRGRFGRAETNGSG
jgi:3-hydroxy-9,10-secoandrosta-1,3,5(10)-triene-9,17-dione monooxygenase reductase component